MTVLSKAMEESVPPDFAGAIGLMQNNILPASEAMASRRGSLSGDWKSVEDDFRCNKQAAKVFFTKIMKASKENATDFYRSFVGLCREHGLEAADLVDAMAGAPAAEEQQAESTRRTKPAAPADDRPPLH